MAGLSVKQQMLDLAEQLPPDATLEDAIDRLVFLAKVERGIAQADRGETVPHEEVKARFGL